MSLSSDLYSPLYGAPVSPDPSCGRGWSVPFGAELILCDVDQFPP